MATVVEIPPMPTPQTVANPRKRKKRAPAAGAAADCFKCADRNIKCDRRRPYCSQCLDVGQECSGYKTQLTWGVGVASRGKLRGLSLPIVGTQKATAADSAPKAKKRRETVTEDDLPMQPPIYEVHGVEHTVAPFSSTALTATAALNQHTPTTNSSTVWDPTFFSAPFEKHRGWDNSYQSQVISVDHYSHGQHSVPAYVNHSHLQPPFQEPSWPQHPTTNTYLSPSILVPSTTAPSATSPSSYFEGPSPFTTNSDLVSPAQMNFPGTPQISNHPTIEGPYDGLSMLLQAGQSVQVTESGIMEEADEELLRARGHGECAVSDEYSLLATSSRFDLEFPLSVLPGIGNIGKTARMQYLINYYAEVISPVIVAFDSPSNPYRTQILRLAESSETLQHAISALAASNLRQRRGIGLLSTGKTAPARRSSFAHVHLSNEYSQNLLTPEEQRREEILHKRLAVSQLNQQLAHPVLRKDDSILATLLILCLFHVCDSGVAKFQTQFAGVRKLLALRGDDQHAGNKDSKWMSRLFTCFDALAATVNDREAQITGQVFDASALCGDWMLENLTGIDGQLFNTVSKLSRLNMLRQKKICDSDRFSITGPLPSPAPNPKICDSLDGNGWMQKENGAGLGITKGEVNDNKAFWQEWSTVRHELLTWKLDTTLFDTMSRESSYLTTDQRLDMENISESFRFAALLYLERLAKPSLPSSDEAIQRWVRQSLDYIKKVVSDVYLLWPLFITGTECIDEDERNVIRGRCTDIQKDSGFVNNASCLQLLEKIWKFNSPSSSPSSDRGSITSITRTMGHSDGRTFPFRDVMVREAAKTEGEGEYIVI